MKRKHYIVISGFSLNDSNRGTAALAYGSITFLYKRGMIDETQELVSFKFIKSLSDTRIGKIEETTINQDGVKWKHKMLFVSTYEKHLALKCRILLPFSVFGRIMKSVSFVAALNGGDGFSDIYGTETFHARLPETFLAMKLGLPLVMLPQTLGPFNGDLNKKLATKILRYSKKVYVRDDKYVSELNKYSIPFEQVKDLSFYMEPQPIDMEFPYNAIGINISGLAYSNSYGTLSGQFDNYPYLIERIILFFQSKGFPVYLIPHSYNYNSPENSNDDMVACRLAYNRLNDKSNVYLIDNDFISPQLKYVISKMSYFIGTRMHANFAAIYMGVPLYGLAYSYKFEGAFEANGVYDNNVSMINNITKEEADKIVLKIFEYYQKTHE